MSAAALWRRETARRCAEAATLRRVSVWTAELIGPPPRLRSGPLLGRMLEELATAQAAAPASEEPAVGVGRARRGVLREPVASRGAIASRAAVASRRAVACRKHVTASAAAALGLRVGRRPSGGRRSGPPSVDIPVPGAREGRVVGLPSGPAARRDALSGDPGGAIRVPPGAEVRWWRRRVAGAAARLAPAGSPSHRARPGDAHDAGRDRAPDALIASLERSWRLDLAGPAAPAWLLRELVARSRHQRAAGAGAAAAGPDPVTPASTHGVRSVGSGASPAPAVARGGRVAAHGVAAPQQRATGAADGHDAERPPRALTRNAPDRHGRPELPGDAAPVALDDRASARPQDDFALADRIARILAEEARRHGIDV